ncbi:MAG: SpoVR family protein [Deltaproteobacteria bacterium]|nr:SpoVR family protein [Deltaproteobacteria bacterium]MBI2347342.1 SpoVR family protein [Deltaproteobacteria bacterium]
MAAPYSIAELEMWNERIQALARDFGLDPCPQEFEICDQEQMLGYMVYSGMPSHYPHWSYGKNYEKLKTLYNYGVSGLPYEMVINSDPSIAYLMRDNSLLLQILTIAHVYGHNDFFKNNFTFKSTRAEFTVETFKAHADRVRRYVEDPSIGHEKVERLLDAAHALSLQCRRNLAVRKETPEEEQQRRLEESSPAEDPFQSIHRRQEYVAPDLNKVPLYPEEDVLIFIRDHNPQFSDWEKDLLTIAHEEAQYFIPQIETKIMNEGYASFWHKRVLETLDLPQGMQIEFLVRHNQVLSPVPGGINPYHLGMKIWEDIERRWDHPTPEAEREYGPRKKSGREKVFEVREVERDSSFLRRYLTEELIRELNLFEYQSRGGERVVSRVADEENWREIKETLIRNVGTGTVPQIKIEDADYNNNRALFLRHHHDGRDLQLEYAEKTLQYLHQLWRREVLLETVINDKKSLLSFSDDKMVIKPLH